MSKRINTEVLIVGSGLSGLLTAIELSNEFQVTILSKNKVNECSTAWAQGGIAAVVDDDDNVFEHVQDTLNNGHGLCKNDRVKKIVEQGKASIFNLIKLGANFTTKEGKLDQTLEGGHSKRRIIYHNDNTGEEIHKSLMKHIIKNNKINIIENMMAIDLIGRKDKLCYGLYAYNSTNNSVVTISAKVVILATGGANKIYQYTTNPNTSTGDGIAMAWRFGCTISNMEFMQFHPTCLYHANEKNFLISESLRGEGAKLINPNGEQFLMNYDKREELAPRDIVARAIDSEMKSNNFECVYLDITSKSKSFLANRFPNIYNKCLDLGIDISIHPIPVVPAAHYTCGGIKTDITGMTDCKNLYAIGEVAHSGFHGANRLASNSLLECAVMSAECCKQIITQDYMKNHLRELPIWDDSYVSDPVEENILISHNWAELRKIMWNYVGILRSNKMLNMANDRLKIISDEVNEFYHTHKISSDLLELRNIIDVAEIIVKSALERKESRGLHYNKDYPEIRDNFDKDTELNNSKKDFIMKIVSRV